MGPYKNTWIQNAIGIAIVAFSIFLGAKSIFKVIGWM
jgi:Mn2+/Fe2+ NRAMP family transporter